MDIEKLREERMQNDYALFHNVIPKRVPINISIGMNAVAEYAGLDPRRAYWDGSILEEKVDELCDMIPSDVCLLGRSVLNPTKYQALGSKAVIMGADGFMQHPNTHMMEAEEYDEFIKDPYAFIVEKAVPRVNANLDITKNPARVSIAIAQANQVSMSVAAKSGPMMARLAKKYGYLTKAARGSGAYAPMDILSDQLRSFSGMSTDIRRYKSKVKDAVEAVSPLNLYVGTPFDKNSITRDVYGFYPFHMATFMRPKDFEELWWPALQRQWNDLAAIGCRCGAFLEDRWDHLLDYVQDLPTGSFFTFEYCDPKNIKEKLGKKFILSSGFPVAYVTQCSKDEVIGKTKEWLDIMAPSGQYSFGFDKSILTMADCNLENLQAIAQTVLEYGVYSNAGQTTGEIFNQADYVKSDLPEFNSRCFKTWEEYKAENPNTPDEAQMSVMAAEDAMVRFYYALLQ